MYSHHMSGLCDSLKCVRPVERRSRLACVFTMESRRVVCRQSADLFRADRNRTDGVVRCVATDTVPCAKLFWAS